jgi:hypothetical protein
MLAARGAVYRSEETAGFRPHTFPGLCQCDVEPVWNIVRVRAAGPHSGRPEPLLGGHRRSAPRDQQHGSHQRLPPRRLRRAQRIPLDAGEPQRPRRASMSAQPAEPTPAAPLQPRSTRGAVHCSDDSTGTRLPQTRPPPVTLPRQRTRGTTRRSQGRDRAAAARERVRQDQRQGAGRRGCEEGTRADHRQGPRARRGRADRPGQAHREPDHSTGGREAGPGGPRRLPERRHRRRPRRPAGLHELLEVARGHRPRRLGRHHGSHRGGGRSQPAAWCRTHRPPDPAPNPAQGSSAGGAPDLDSQIAEAQKAGDTSLAIHLQNQKLITATPR